MVIVSASGDGQLFVLSTAPVRGQRIGVVVFEGLRLAFRHFVTLGDGNSGLRTLEVPIFCW